MLDREKVSRLIRYELVEIYEAIKENTDLSWIPLEMGQVEVSFDTLRLYHII